MATTSGLRGILQRHLANAITTPSTFFHVSVRRSDTTRLTLGADPYRRRSTLNMPSGLPSWHVISSFELNCTSQTRGHPYKLYKPRIVLITLFELRTLAFALSTYGTVSLLIVLISPRLLPLNALLNRLILLRFCCVITFN